ncbi:MAG TPA: ABC transporter permease, partial [Actinomycetales bacterium]|nr:ABC transporter permease [Actinomycetales bacterium]
MNTTYLRLEMLRVLREPVSLFFIVGLPALMYVIFGASTEWGAYEIGNGNVSMSIMIAMAAYGAVTATTGVGGSAAVERMQGWGRQLALTPLRDVHYVAVKAAVSMSVAALPVLVIFALGAGLGAQAEGRTWLVSMLIVLAGSAMFALYGLLFGLAFRSEGAVGIASASLVLLGFLGNVFMPLSGAMLAIAKFTPLYGYAALARYPLTEGWTVDMASGELIAEPL